ncbi:hypothetical protein BpHYR1_035489 [Brachionus plicatilis]|uniref:Uncharacterized protein n=1 Tax=Brachionus plicatilis TaxID=10195 RepID=A0A3M7QHN6_BRAPC|nr:hypothetical protein BpHYR1_035489 [Brachionus plicatilis]
MCYLSERYVRVGLSHSVPLVIRLVNEYREGFESRFIEYPTPLCNSLCNCYLEISSFFSLTKYYAIISKNNSKFYKNEIKKY